MKNKLDCLKLINFIEKSSDFKKNILPQNILIAIQEDKIPVKHSPFFYILSKKMELNIGVVY
jgi:hypothetical protein